MQTSQYDEGILFLIDNEGEWVSSVPNLVDILEATSDDKWSVWRSCVVEKALHVLANVACHPCGKQDCVNHCALLKASRFLWSFHKLESQHASSLMMGCTILKEAKIQMATSNALLLAVQVRSREDCDVWVRKNLLQTLRNLSDLPSSFLKTCHFFALLDRDHSIADEVFGVRSLRAYHELLPKLSLYEDLTSLAQFESSTYPLAMWGDDNPDYAYVSSLTELPGGLTK